VEEPEEEEGGLEEEEEEGGLEEPEEEPPVLVEGGVPVLGGWSKMRTKKRRNCGFI
jgi:hypothetical protein